MGNFLNCRAETTSSLLKYQMLRTTKTKRHAYSSSLEDSLSGFLCDFVKNLPVRLTGTASSLPRVSDCDEQPKQMGTLTLHRQRDLASVSEVILSAILPFALQG